VIPTNALIDLVASTEADLFAVEQIEARGMAVSQATLDTAMFVGMFVQARKPGETALVKRREVKSFLCGSQKAKDANIRQAIIDMYPATGGGATPQIGTKSQPGPLYGLKSHCWAAMAVALTAMHRGNTNGAPSS
jgi:Holliday junction resolvasome RuvABC endonuclease subunit